MSLLKPVPGKEKGMAMVGLDQYWFVLQGLNTAAWKSKVLLGRRKGVINNPHIDAAGSPEPWKYGGREHATTVHQLELFLC